MLLHLSIHIIMRLPHSKFIYIKVIIKVICHLSLYTVSLPLPTAFTASLQ